MENELRLKIRKDSSSLTLLQEGQILDTRSWTEGRDMGRRLFESIKEILEKNSLKPEDVSDFSIESELPEIYTSMRIAETVKKVYSFGVRSKTKKQR